MFWKVYIKIEKTIIKFDVKIPKQKFYQHKRPISIKNVDIEKCLIRPLLVKKDLNTSLATIILKK